MSTPRKTSDQMLNDSYIRSSIEPIKIYRFDDTHMTIINEKTNGEYLVEIDNDNRKVIDCTCPHWNYRVGTINIPEVIPCKHMIVVAVQLGYGW